jgi:beta-lactamase superfamily II metal-dependent hydrolase
MEVAMKRLFGVIFVLTVTCKAAFGLSPEPDAVFVRVIDVGTGLCCVAKMPGDHFMVYDAGDYPAQGKIAFDGIAQVVPQGHPIELLVLSHSDSVGFRLVLLSGRQG